MLDPFFIVFLKEFSSLWEQNLSCKSDAALKEIISQTD